MTFAFIFPGQGSQSVGMGHQVFQAFEEARDVFNEVDDALKQKLSKICFEGPESDLTLTQNTQPALMAVSVALFKVLEKQVKFDFSKLSYMAGHSLGEYSALCSSGVFSIADTARLLRIRGNAMQEAVPVGVGGMIALLGADFSQAQEIATQAAQGDVLEVANDNGAGQQVLSGHMAAVDRVLDVATSMGIKRAVKLPVSAPFHCSLMDPAAQKMKAAFEEVDGIKALKPIIANVTAKPESDPSVIKDLLVKQVTGRVRWREIVESMRALGIEHVVEIGAGKVLTGLVKRIDPQLQTSTINTPEDLDAFAKSLS